jgi:aspartyl aminopeptidase
MTATPRANTPDVTEDLLAFIDASPSPYHAVATAAARLERAGFREAELGAAWDEPGGPRYVRRGGTLVAWRPGRPGAGFRIVGAHTDSPNLRLKPQPDHRSAGFRQLGVEVYGGALLNSWLDRDLGLSGRVAVADGATVEQRLFRIDEPILRIPQLAIHLDRDVNERGLILNRQQHLAPIWGVGPGDGRGVRDLLAVAVDADPARVVAWDAMCHDLTPSAFVGVDRDMVSAPRIDNLLSCHAAVRALVDADTSGARADRDVTAVVALFDHEEVGSTTDRGAAGGFLAAVLERVSASLGLDRAGHLQALAASHCVSADGAHATHPNYPERHEPDHQVALNGGPVLKVNASARYATDAVSAAPFLAACAAVEVPVQWFVTRSDLACGSTIGPLTAAQLAVPTVDVGVAQLAMHSSRELTGAFDPPRFVAALGAYLAA